MDLAEVQDQEDKKMSAWCGRFVVCLMAVGLFLTAGVSQAGDIAGPGESWWDQEYKWCPDPPDDAVGGNSYEVLGIGWTLVDHYLIVCVETNFPLAGLNGPDSYSSNAHFSPGDLYINVGGMFQMGNGFQFGIVTEPNPTGLDKTADPNDGPWSSTFNPGDLIIGANFATGTFEGYPTGTPSDGNDGDGVNDYPTLIMNYLNGVVAGVGNGFHYDGNYYYYVDLELLDFWSEVYGGPSVLDDDWNRETSIQLSWSMECGNDLAEYKIEIPEPTTVALLGAGMAAMAAKKRKRLS